jgi:predicted ATPase
VIVIVIVVMVVGARTGLVRAYSTAGFAVVATAARPILELDRGVL